MGSYEITQEYNQYLYHYEKVVTDVAYSRVEWYVDDVLRETTSGDGVKTEATFQPWFLIGSIPGTDYEIKAIAYPWVGEGSDTDSFTLTVYQIFEILEMRPADWSASSYEAYSYGGYMNHTAYVKTSHPYFNIGWAVDWEITYTTHGDGDTTETSLAFYTLPGDIKGKTYTITASAVANRADNQGNLPMDIKSYELTVYEPIIRTDVEGGGDPNLPNVNGHAELTRFYKSGSDVVVDWYVSAYYNGDNPPGFYNVTTEFKNTIQDFWGPGAHKQAPPVGDEAGPSGFLSADNRSFVESGSISNSLVGGADDEFGYNCAAYIRLTVSARLRDDWHFIHTEFFAAD